MTAAFVGNSIGGNLPSWIAVRQGVSPTSSTAYAGALAIVAGLAVVGLVPYFFMKLPKLKMYEKALFAPFAYASKQPKTLWK